MEMGGTTLALIKIEVIYVINEDLLIAIMYKVKNTNIKNFMGEDVDKTVIQIRGSLLCLNGTYNQTPPDIVTTATQEIQTSSVVELKKLRYTSKLPCLYPKKCTIEDILKLDENKYTDMVINNKW